MTLIIDTVPFNNELDMLTCRLVEIGDAVDYMVVVEADVDHQDHPKPFHLSENLDRFEQWADKLVVVRATGLPTVAEDSDPWARELAQREHTFQALRKLDVQPDDIILHGDLDEIPTAVACRNVRPKGFVSFTQRGHFWSCRWYWGEWQGTVAARARDVQSFGAMRSARLICPNRLPAAGWHLSWLGGGDVARAKVGSFCHPEVEKRIVDGLADESFLRDGYHVDGVKMKRCEIDRTFPKWIREGHCPESWLL